MLVNNEERVRTSFVIEVAVPEREVVVDGQSLGVAEVLGDCDVVPDLEAVLLTEWVRSEPVWETEDQEYVEVLVAPRPDPFPVLGPEETRAK